MKWIIVGTLALVIGVALSVAVYYTPGACADPNSGAGFALGGGITMILSLVLVMSDDKKTKMIGLIGTTIGIGMMCSSLILAVLCKL